VEGEWLNGVPNGVCIVDGEKIRGVVTFTNGKLSGGPMWYEDKALGLRISLEYSSLDGKVKGI
jgi:hypothetical protein